MYWIFFFIIRKQLSQATFTFVLQSTQRLDFCSNQLKTLILPFFLLPYNLPVFCKSCFSKNVCTDNGKHTRVIEQ